MFYRRAIVRATLGEQVLGSGVVDEYLRDWEAGQRNLAVINHISIWHHKDLLHACGVSFLHAALSAARGKHMQRALARRTATCWRVNIGSTAGMLAGCALAGPRRNAA